MNRKNTPAWLKIIFFLALTALGAAAGYYGVIWVKTWLPLKSFAPQSGLEKAGIFVLLAFSIWFSIAVHELGHLLAGLAQGFRMALYVAGFLGARGTRQGVRFFFNRNYQLMGGLAATYPEHLESGPALRHKFALIVGAGPFASLLLCAIGMGLLLWLTLDSTGAPTLAIRLAVPLALFTAMMSGMIFLATMIPSTSGGFMSDGARMISLLGSREKAEYEEATLSVMALQGAGKMPSEYPPHLLERLRSRPADSLLGLNGHFLSFVYHLDREEPDAALALAHTIENNITAVPAPFRSYYLKDVVFFHAFLNNDPETAGRIWAGIEQQAAKEPDAGYCRVKAALAIAGQQLEAAREWVQKGIKLLDELPFEGQRKFEEKWLQRLV